MKIGQITWWRNNYGSILQALALQRKVEELTEGDCEIICQYGKKVTSFSNLRDKLVNIGIWETCKRIFGKYTFRGVRKRTKRMEKFVADNIKISKESYNENTIIATNDLYDTFICGSDQIWNPSLSPVNSFYWLDFVKEGKKKISYAPSVGVNKFSEEQKEIIKNNLKCFDGISCRENSGTKAINDALEKEACVTVLDPTLIVEKDLWDSFSNKRLISQKYIFTYMLRGTKQQRKLIKKFAKENNLIIVSIPFLECDNLNMYDLCFANIKIWDADPADFISLIRHAEYVFTDSFHSMIFSTIYHKNFYTFPKIGKNQQNRILNFQDEIIGSSRMISGVEDLKCEIEKVKPINWKIVDENIKNKRKESLDFLVKSLKK